MMSSMEPATVFDEYQPRLLAKSQSSTAHIANPSGSTSSRGHLQKTFSEQDKSHEARYQISPRQVDNINEIRRLVREQSSLGNGGGATATTTSLDDDEIEVPVRKFTPLPDIPRSDDAYYRTESKLIKDNISSSGGSGGSSGGSSANNTNNAIFVEKGGDEANIVTESVVRERRKETRYHFGGGGGTAAYGTAAAGKVNFAHRLPALEKTFNHTINNTMDLDEDLPMNPVSTTPEYINQRQIYTSPGDRVISPIKRPQAPSPAASAYRRKSNKSFNNSQSDSDNDLIIT